MIKAVFLALGLMAALATPALALDARRAEVVVGIMEQIAAGQGEPVYLGGGGEMFAYDAEGDGLIAAAGFDEAAWIAAHDAVISGHIALIPDDAFEAFVNTPLARLEASTALNDDVKAEFRADLDVQIAEIRAAREAGRAHVDAGRALAPRLQVLLFGGDGAMGF